MVDSNYPQKENGSVITDKIGRVTFDGIGKINASLPNRYVEFEYHDRRAAAEFLNMPGRLARLEQDVWGIKQDIKEVLDLVSCNNLVGNRSRF